MASLTGNSVAEISPPSGFTLDAGPKPPPGFSVDGLPPPKPAAEEPKTTATGLAASTARGAAPYAAGAAAGAAMGAPFAGIGAVPGALAGMGAVGLTELGGTLYNALAHRTSLPAMVTPQDASDRVLDAMGIKRPASTAEKTVEMAAGMAPFGATPVKGAVELGELVAKNEAGAAEKYINGLYSRAIKPSTVGRDTPMQRRSAIDDIISNKDNLRYTNEMGEVASTGHLPETVEQFGQAVDHAKSNLFEQWSALARQSGEVGAAVDVTPVVRELRAKAADPVLLRQSPNAANYAADLANRYEAAGRIPPLEAQREITGWNTRLKAYYRNPMPDGTATANIDEIAARGLRKQLDGAIEGSVGPGYQELKNRYGALSAIEGDVDRAARRISNREAGGGILGRGVNLLSTEEVLRGLMTGNARSVATGAGLKAWGEYVKWRNAPNRAVKEIFKTAEKHRTERPSPSGDGGLPPVIETGPQPPRPSGGAMPEAQPGKPASPGGTSVASPPLQRIPPGAQPARPSSPSQDIWGRGPNEFVVVPGGGRGGAVVNPDDPVARALGY